MHDDTGTNVDTGTHDDTGEHETTRRDAVPHSAARPEPGTGDSSGGRALVLIDDEDLLDDVLRVAAAADCPVQRIPDIASLRSHWSSAPLVLLDDRHAGECARAELPRREGVLVLNRSQIGEPPVELWQHAVAVGARAVVGLPTGESELAGAFADVLTGGSSATASVIGVLGGRGGAGASVLSCALGWAVLREGRTALLVDCDPAGGGVDMTLGLESEDGLRWSDVQVSSGRIPAHSLHAALPGWQRGAGGLAVLSCGRDGIGPSPEALGAVIDSARRTGDVVICDLPRQPDAGDGAPWVALQRTDLTVLVVPGEVRACASGRLIADRLADQGIAVRVLVREPAPGGLRPDEIATAVGRPLLTSMRTEARLPRQLDNGQFQPSPRGPLAKAATVVLSAIPDGDRTLPSTERAA